MTLDALMNNTVSVLKQNGEVIENVKASVQKKQIFINRSDILIEMGDLIRHSMSNGSEDTYKVLDPGFHEKFHSIEAGYQMDVRKLGLPEAQSAVQHITYNISGTNNRLNQNSTDNSVNVLSTNPSIQEHIESLRREIEQLKLDEMQKKASYEVIDALDSQLKSEKPSKAVVKALLGGLPNAGSLASIGSLIVSLVS